jgi:peroxiredoxin
MQEVHAVAVNSQMLDLGTPAPDFKLPDADGNIVSRHDVEGAPALLIAFLSKHCPYVQHIRAGLIALGRDLAARDVAVIGIVSNDWERHPDDAPDVVAREGYPFPVLFDESQDVAKAFRAACTPDFFLFDGAQWLVYRGQMDDARPRNDAPVTGADLRAAIDAVLEGRAVDPEQRPSIGCSIKWRPGNEPNYAA